MEEQGGEAGVEGEQHQQQETDIWQVQWGGDGGEKTAQLRAAQFSDQIPGTGTSDTGKVMIRCDFLGDSFVAVIILFWWRFGWFISADFDGKTGEWSVLLSKVVYRNVPNSGSCWILTPKVVLPSHVKLMMSV